MRYLITGSGSIKRGESIRGIQSFHWSVQKISEDYSSENQQHLHCRRHIQRNLVILHKKSLRSAVHCENDVDKSVADVMKEKKINEHKDVRFKTHLKVCLLQITGYKKLYLEVEDLRKQPYDSGNQKHEEQLMELWDLLKPKEKLKSRITKQWGDIGFQGDDPKTDFRGMGMLGLANLLYFSHHYTEEAFQVLSHSYHPKIGYSYAIVGINLTEMAYSLLRSGALKSQLYNLVSGSPQMQHFHQFFCYLIYEFDKFWFEEEPENIMHFNHFREKFHSKVTVLLSDPDTVLVLKSTKNH
ncbi:ELMO domain-containing protein 2 isoform X3 [Ambystoma mexicanum]|uniref:ELMO domain-containing protein 2 isoform X3 n=1 Tax=Ambystoma mexicanum TaxID=8296 RepID=UPI0037E83AE7